MATDIEKALKVSESEIKSLIDRFRAIVQSKIEADQNYDLHYIKLSEFDIDMLHSQYKNRVPLIIQDKNKRLWVFGQDQAKFAQLTALDPNFQLKLKFKETPSSITSKRLLTKNPTIYAEINKQKAHVQPLHYSYFPKEIMECEKLRSEAVGKMRKFVEGQEFTKLCQELMLIFNQFSKKDLELLDEIGETALGRKLRMALRQLEANGFYGTRNEILNFWSGTKAQFKADAALGEISCSKVPTVFMGFEFLSFLQSNNIAVSDYIILAISKLYVKKATGTVNVYLSANKPSEKACILVGNIFWNTELPLLQKLRHEGIVKKIMIHTLNEQNKQNEQSEQNDEWALGIDLNSQAADTLLLSRRSAYQPDVKKIFEKQTSSVLETQELKHGSEQQRIQNMRKNLEALTEQGDKAKPFYQGISSYENTYDWEANSGPRPVNTLWNLRQLIAHWKTKASLACRQRKNVMVQKQHSSDLFASFENKLALDHGLESIAEEQGMASFMKPPPLLLRQLSCRSEASSGSGFSSQGPSLRGPSNEGAVLSNSASLVEPVSRREPSYHGIPPMFLENGGPTSPRA